MVVPCEYYIQWDVKCTKVDCGGTDLRVLESIVPSSEGNIDRLRCSFDSADAPRLT